MSILNRYIVFVVDWVGAGDDLAQVREVYNLTPVGSQQYESVILVDSEEESVIAAKGNTNIFGRKAKHGDEEDEETA